MILDKPPHRGIYVRIIAQDRISTYGISCLPDKRDERYKGWAPHSYAAIRAREAFMTGWSLDVHTSSGRGRVGPGEGEVVLARGSSSFVSNHGYPQLGDAPAGAAGAVKADEFGAGGFEADLKSLDLAEPAVGTGLVDAVGQSDCERSR